MSFSEFPDPPTKETLADARRTLNTTRASVRGLTNKIDTAEATLARIIRESQSAIDEMHTERKALEGSISRTLAYLSPIRRLPIELLREVFLWTFEDHPCTGWVLAAVCTSWRRLSLRMPRIWSKVSTDSRLHRYPLVVSGRCFPVLPERVSCLPGVDTCIVPELCLSQHIQRRLPLRFTQALASERKLSSINISDHGPVNPP